MIFAPRLLVIWVFLFSSAACAAELSPAESVDILERVDNLWRGNSSYARLTMRVKTKHYQRELSMESWSLGQDYSFVKILAPVKEKGTVTLKSKQNVYTYLPKTDRTIRLTAGMMSGSWMGSHFTNDDLVKESQLSEDYHVRAESTVDEDSRPVYRLTLTAKQNSAVVWGSILIIIDRSNDIPIREFFYDEDGELIRTLSFHDITSMGGRLIPARMQVLPQDQPDELTEILYQSIEFDVPLTPDFFSLAQLRRRL